MIKRETKEVGTEIRPGKGVLKKREIPKHQETLSCRSVASLGIPEGNITGKVNKQIIKTHRLRA